MLNKTPKQKNNSRKAFDWILNIILIILLIIGAYMFYERIFGGSPTDFQFILWIAGFFGTGMFKLFNLIYGINREVGEVKTELKVGVRGGFNRIKDDVSNINSRLDRLNNNIQKLIRRK